MFDAVASEQRAPEAGDAHPRLHILGLLEARLLSFDLTLIAGLDETVWPPQAETDAFLNRPMRAALGLSAPERRIGQTAHDFVAALGAPEAILSRAKKRGGAPTVASRFLQRMGAVAGEAAYGEACARGEAWLALAREIDRPETVAPIRRPEPRPPLALRPDEPQRHAHRDAAPRPLCDLCRAHPEAAAARADRRDAWRARDRHTMA